MDEGLLERIERYYDTVPRAAARPEELPPLVLFVRQGAGWPYYARPLLGARAFTAAGVRLVRERQRALGVPERFEWIDEVTPGLGVAATEAGLVVTRHPLLVLGRHQPVEPPNGLTIRRATAEDDLMLFSAVAQVGFRHPGTARGAAGVDEARRIAVEPGAGRAQFEREQLRAGRTVMVIALADGAPVGVGSHQPRDGVSEIVGVATLPAFRRRGIAAAITSQLVRDALERGVQTVFLSADDEEIARVYERVGFHPVATACIAEPLEAS